MSEQNDTQSDGAASVCLALILYTPPAIYTFAEQSKFRDCSYAELAVITKQAITRSLGMPAHVLDATNCNYSSAKLDSNLLFDPEIKYAAA